MSGFLSLWAIVDKDEIAAINAAALPLHGSAECGACVDDARQASGSTMDITPGFCGIFRSKLGRGRAVRLTSYKQVTRIEDNYVGEPAGYIQYGRMNH